MTKQKKIDTETAARNAAQACLTLPPALLMQAMTQLVSAYALEHLGMRSLTPKAMTIEGITKHFTELLNLNEHEQRWFKLFLANPEVQQFTHFPTSPK